MWKVCRALFRAVMPNYKCDIKSFKSHIKGKKKKKTRPGRLQANGMEKSSSHMLGEQHSTRNQDPCCLGS